MTIILFGPPGSGKGTQSALISEKYKLKHISTGDILRHEMQLGTELGLSAKKYINEGKLVPDELIIKMLMSVIETTDKNLNGVLLDGFPRTTAQAEALEQNLSISNKQTNVLIDLKVDNDELTTRLLLRGKASGRADDNADTIKKRLEVYTEQTLPVSSFYQKLNKYACVDGLGEINTIFEQICSEIDKAS